MFTFLFIYHKLKWIIKFLFMYFSFFAVQNQLEKYLNNTHMISNNNVENN